LAVFLVAIFYMDVNIIGRSSGRSATGAAAYRSGEKLRSVAHASYQSGEKIQSKNGKITHDYRKKKGVIHSEIILPDNAPEEYKDRQTLWNAVEISEKRKDAQLAREIIVALPREFDLSEHIEVTRRYVKENFVDKGMIVDFAIHDNKDANPHAHIMLTTRTVTPDGFGLKNTNWNKKENLLSWRKAWTHIINSTLESKGLDARIDHRSYKEQGLDREPLIHLGHKAAALERQGIKTERGDYNREITRRNIERAELKEAIHMEFQKLEKLAEKLERIIDLAEGGSETVPNEVVTKLKTAKRINEAQENHDAPDKTPSAPNAEPLNVVKKTKHRKKLRKSHNALALELSALNSKKAVYEAENMQLHSHTEEIDELDKNMQTLHERTTQLLAERNTFWYRVRKKKIETELKEIYRKEQDVQHHFWHKYRINPNQAPQRIEQILEQIQDNKSKIDAINSNMATIFEQQEAIWKEYGERAHMIKKRSKRRVPDMPKIDPLTGRPKTMEFLRYLRQQDEVEKMKRKELEKIRRIKPQKILLIESSEQKKRSLSDVIGNKAKSGEPMRLSVPPSKKKAQIIKQST